MFSIRIFLYFLFFHSVSLQKVLVNQDGQICESFDNMGDADSPPPHLLKNKINQIFLLILEMILDWQFLSGAFYSQLFFSFRQLVDHLEHIY